MTIVANFGENFNPSGQPKKRAVFSECSQKAAPFIYLWFRDYFLGPTVFSNFGALPRGVGVAIGVI